MEAALQDVLTALGDRMAPVSMAGERTLPTSADYAELFPEAGLVRGRVLSCTGAAATSVMLGLIAPAVAAGSWVAMIDVPTLGLDAAREMGVALERVVAVDTARHGDRHGDGQAGASWADVVAAAADGFDVLVVRVPADVRATTVRKVMTRLQQCGVVMIVLGDPGPVVCDGVIDTDIQRWSGLGAGWGHLSGRRIDVTSSGRRLPGRRCRTIAFPDTTPVDTQDIDTQDIDTQDIDTQDIATQNVDVSARAADRLRGLPFAALSNAS